MPRRPRCLVRWTIVASALLPAVAAHGQQILRVDDDAPLGGDGFSWNTAYRYLRDAIQAAGPGSGVAEIRVAQGWYYPDDTEYHLFCPPPGNCTDDPKAWFFQPAAWPDFQAFRGGYAGLAGPDPDARDPVLFETVLSGDIQQDGELNHFSNHVILFSGEEIEIDGFTIRDGNARMDFPQQNRFGGGLRMQSPGTIRRCTFVNNRSEPGGNNEGGGGLYINATNGVTVDRCIFVFNSSTDNGGALSITNAPVRLTNCIFAHNSAGLKGGAVHLLGSSAANAPSFINCTFYGNQAGQVAESIFNDYNTGSTVLVYNSIAHQIFHGNGSNTFTFLDYCATAELDPDVDLGDHNIGVCCVLYVNPDDPNDDYHNLDFHLDLGGDAAPLVDAGSNELVPPDIPHDFEGNARIVDGHGDGSPAVDIGAYEFVPGCPLCPGARVWTGEGLDDAFESIDNWDIGPPGPANSAIFLLPDAHLVDFDSGISNYRLETQRGDVTLQLDGHSYLLTKLDDFFEPPLIVGKAPGQMATLRIEDGELLAQGGAVLGQVADAVGAMEVGSGANVGIGPLPTIGELRIGSFGRGMLHVTDEGLDVPTHLACFEATIGEDPAAPSSAVVSGPFALWDLFVLLTVRHGSLTLSDGAVVYAGFGIFVLPEGAIQGEGTISGIVFNVGDLMPGNSTGTLTIDGDYRQVEEDDPLLGTGSGSLFLDLGGTTPGVDQDQLVVTGEAQLGGGLFISLTGPFEPQLDDTFSILQAASIASPFDVVFAPGLPGGRFMRLAYGLGPSGSATVVVDDLESLFTFDDNDPIDVSGGVPSAVAVGDLDGDGDEDVAITLLGATAHDNGAVLVLRNDGFNPQGQWLIEGTTQTTVGREPSGIAIGLFDNDADADVAVTNAGDDDVSVLINSGLGDGSFGLPGVFSVGDQPSDVAVADFNGDTFDDLIVSNAGDDDVRVLDGDGTGTFLAGASFGTGLSPLAVDPSDLDNDKDPDAVAANAVSNTITVAFNLGGSLAAPITIPVGAGPLDLGASDFDGNTFVDVVTANNGDGTVSVVLNNGDGTFAPAVNLPVGDEPRSITPIDLEGDADDDVAVVAKDALGERVVQVLRNDLSGGQLIFASAAELAAGEDPALVTRGDLDDDTLEDLITVNETLGLGPASMGPVPMGSVKARPNVTGAMGCPWDCDGLDDGIVSVTDLLALLAQYNPQSPTNCTGGSCDYNGDGCVDVVDLLKLLAHYDPAGLGCP